ncbi:MULTISPECIES: hypothetical protein [unclassified Streptomyces]|uniref:hypothetical protein n=1 Tax=unclassified Streptomyces TaxID=2593676 RepID=UPI000BAC7C81|nr:MULTISPECIES: hypothetical protein [unclassified Streptomyces]ASY37058.1 hypothetical protein CAC01_30970 [Streptomyces sp. CLI2509]MYX22185.1 hypothetical protein [Streptomyces sp. SID8380]
MNSDQHTAPTVGSPTPTLPTTIWQPTPPPHPALLPAPAPHVTLYQVPVPDAVPVQLPDGSTAWGRPIQPHLEPAPLPAPAEPMPAWAKALGMTAASLTLLALGGALALRIAAPALEGLVDILDMIWRVALVLAVLLFGARFLRAFLGHAPTNSSTPSPASFPAEQHIVFAPQIDTAGTRLLGRSGDVNIQFGDANRNKQ